MRKDKPGKYSTNAEEFPPMYEVYKTNRPRPVSLLPTPPENNEGKNLKPRSKTVKKKKPVKKKDRIQRLGVDLIDISKKVKEEIHSTRKAQLAIRRTNMFKVSNQVNLCNQRLLSISLMLLHFRRSLNTESLRSCSEVCSLVKIAVTFLLIPNP